MKLTGASLPRLGARDWALLTAQAAAGSVGYTVLLITGLQRASAVDAGIILGALPLVSAALAVTLLGERPGRSTLVAIAIATAGVWLTMASPAGPEGASSLTAMRWCWAPCCEGLFILLHKRLRTPVPPLALSTIMTAIGLAASALASLLAEAPWTLALPADAVLAVAYYALAPTVGGFLLWYAGAARSNGAAALFTAVAPVCAVLLAAGLLGEGAPASSPAWPAYWRPSRCTVEPRLRSRPTLRRGHHQALAASSLAPAERQREILGEYLGQRAPQRDARSAP